ncbi:hypothetical protein [Thiomicrospira microaerophila]|uniref:hypothetical protein n=1 Tax=Thiomicrospira microaerophila TaxID=406020 RepID=UPI0005CA6448|nr:hypothetical protein [Thiomicrospira microaerophila]
MIKTLFASVVLMVFSGVSNASQDLFDAVEFLKTGDTGFAENLEVTINEQCEIKSIVKLDPAFLKIVILEDMNQFIWDSAEIVTPEDVERYLKISCRGVCRYDANGLATEFGGDLFHTHYVSWAGVTDRQRIHRAITIVKKYCPGGPSANFKVCRNTA